MSATIPTSPASPASPASHPHAAPAGAAPRFDLYAAIHKGLRAFMSHTLVRVGRMDPHDPDDVGEAMAELDALLDFCEGHVAHENTFVHAAMEARAPGATTDVAHDHVDHLRAVASMRALMARVPGSAEAAHALYHALSEFVADNLAHMGREETHHNAALWATHDDGELRAIHGAIQASLTPEEARVGLRWVLPHLSPAERAAALAGARRAAPPAVFEGMLALVRPLLGGRDWRKLSLALGL